MGMLFEYACSRCSFRQPASSSRCDMVYETDKGAYVPMVCSTQWCNQCSGLRHVENLDIDQSLQELQRVQATLSSARSARGFFRKYIRGVTNDEIDKSWHVEAELDSKALNELGNVVKLAVQRIEMLLRRTDPPRCLTCGLSYFPNVSGHPDDCSGQLRHPGCDGEINIEVRGHINFGRDWCRNVFSTTGVYLRNEVVKMDDPWTGIAD